MTLSSSPTGSFGPGQSEEELRVSGQASSDQAALRKGIERLPQARCVPQPPHLFPLLTLPPRPLPSCSHLLHLHHTRHLRRHHRRTPSAFSLRGPVESPSHVRLRPRAAYTNENAAPWLRPTAARGQRLLTVLTTLTDLNCQFTSTTVPHTPPGIRTLRRGCSAQTFSESPAPPHFSPEKWRPGTSGMPNAACEGSAWGGPGCRRSGIGAVGARAESRNSEEICYVHTIVTSRVIWGLSGRRALSPSPKVWFDSWHTQG